MNDAVSDYISKFINTWDIKKISLTIFFGDMAESGKAPDCKSAVARARWFKSICPHQLLKERERIVAER